MNIKWLLILLILSNFQCKKVEINNNLPQLSISSIISPSDSVIKVFIYKVHPVGEKYSQDIPVVENAKVSLSTKNSSKELFYNPAFKGYSIANNSFIIAGAQFDLKVLLDGIAYIASTVVPSGSIDFEYNTKIYKDYSTVECSWTDPPNEKNYYNLEARSGSAADGVYYPFTWDNKSDLWQTSDELLDGKTINSPIGYLNGNSEKILPFTIAFSLFHMDPVYFEHAQKIRKKGETGGFFSQLAAPIIFKSNFSNNALGFFGSYTSVSKRVIFK